MTLTYTDEEYGLEMKSSRRTFLKLIGLGVAGANLPTAGLPLPAASSPAPAASSYGASALMQASVDIELFIREDLLKIVMAEMDKTAFQAGG